MKIWTAFHIFFLGVIREINCQSKLQLIVIIKGNIETNDGFYDLSTTLSLKRNTP